MPEERMLNMLVSQEKYPTIKTSDEWLQFRKATLTAIVEATDRAFRYFSTVIHPDDEMWRGLLIGQEKSDPTYFRTHYFFGGRSAIKNISEGLIMAEAPMPKRVLDFPCSHGRVTRFLRVAFPDADLYVGDLNHPGVDFCADAFNAKPVYSEIDLDRVDMPKDLDLIWCSSLATHLPEEGCIKLFNKFADSLAEGAIAGITTCGRGMDYMQRKVAPAIAPDIYEQIVSDLERTGFGYRDYPGAVGYGMTFVDLRWIQKVVRSRPDITLLAFRESAWHGWQDIVWIQKTAIGRGYNWDTAS